MTNHPLLNSVSAAAVLSLGLFAGATQADIIHADDVIIDGSLCVGFDCVNGEVFEFDTIRLKENNLRIKFMDTSVAASFPRNDWQIRANSSANGGANAFFIDDMGTANTTGQGPESTPFTIEANAATNAFYIDDGERVGLGTSSPSVELHIVDGDTPTVRLQQDTSSGFDPHTWDVAGNETNFFIRDVTSGSTLPFRIRPGAPSSSVMISANGNVGLGDATPEEELDIQGGANDTIAIELENDTTWRIRNQGAAGATNGWLEFRNADAATRIPMRIAANANNNLLLVGAADAATADADQVTITGDLVISGQCTEVDGACADYVFEDGYELMPLHDVSAFIAENGHLPNIPSAAEMEQGGVNMAMMSGRLLAKIEELTLYTLEQQETNLQQQQTIDALMQRLEALTD